MEAMRIRYYILFLTLTLLVNSCKKESDENYIPNTPIGTLSIHVSHGVGTSSLTFDTLIYSNAAGNKYSVMRLYYYVSGVTLYKGDGLIRNVSGVKYFDASTGETTWTLSNVPIGTYTGIQFYIGLDAAHNISGTLPAIMENVNMAWPDEMGGGYHFMKLEGHYIDTAGKERGYTMHLGKNLALVTHERIATAFNISENQETGIDLQMDISEWFKNPYNYNFNTDGNYTMGVDSLMQRISNNGKDVFHIR